VLGLIKNFNVLAASPQLLEAGALSAGIAEALITTAAGLSIAVGAYILYVFITGVIDRRIREMNEFATNVVKLLMEECNRMSFRFQRTVRKKPRIDIVPMVTDDLSHRVFHAVHYVSHKSAGLDIKLPRAEQPLLKKASTTVVTIDKQATCT